MKVALVIVNYNNIKLSLECIESFKIVFNDLYVAVVDNSNIPEQSLTDTVLEEFLGIGQYHLIRPIVNIGYFPGLALGIDLVSKRDFDFYLIGNNDVICDSDWNQVLRNRISELKEHPVISPRIVTLDGVEQNPMVKDAYSLLYLLSLMIYNSNYGLSYFVLKFVRQFGIYKRRQISRSQLKEGKIGIGFGAFYILTKRFFENSITLPSNSFLMGEEQFLYMELKSKNTSFYFLPELILIHKEHSSIVKLPKKEIWKYNSRAFWSYIWHMPIKLF